MTDTKKKKREKLCIGLKIKHKDFGFVRILNLIGKKRVAIMIGDSLATHICSKKELTYI